MNSKTKNKGLFFNLNKYKYAYILILPSLLFVFAFAYMPMTGIVLAFKKYDLFKGVWGSPWVGFDNFKAIFQYPNMVDSIINTFIYGSTILFLGFPFPVILALLFNELTNVRYKKIVQTVSYMPYFLSWISVIGIFYSIFSFEGTFNQIIGSIVGKGYEPVNILMDSKYFLPVLFFSNLWKNVGWSSVVFLAAIAGIDPALYEAAKIDGCTKFKQVLHITLPCIRTTIIIVLIMQLGSLVNMNFEQVYGFQNVYTQEKTEVINTLIYRQGIQNGKYSLATAFGLAQGLVTITLLLTANAISKKLFETSIW